MTPVRMTIAVLRRFVVSGSIDHRIAIRHTGATFRGPGHRQDRCGIYDIQHFGFGTPPGGQHRFGPEPVRAAARCRLPTG